MEAKEEEMMKRKEPANATSPSQTAQKCQMVYLKRSGTKHTTREPLLVTGVGEKVTVRRLLHSTPQARLPPRIFRDKQEIAPKFLHIPRYVPPHRRRNLEE